jgi:hypothetical protein
MTTSTQAPFLPVWFLRIRRGKIAWSTTQAGTSAKDAESRYLAGYSFWGVDVSDYQIIDTKPASAEAYKLYYKTGKEEK